VEAGEEGDLVLFDATVSEWQPLYNPVSNLVYGATGNTVKHVFGGGELSQSNLPASYVRPAIWCFVKACAFQP
jgi:cytosine/adenosine deaminase-related metal-dependent hydrolase